MPNCIRSLARLSMALLVIVNSGAALAKGKSDPLIAGIKSFDQGRYEQAIKQLNAVFEDKTRTRSDTATALYYRGKTHHRLDRADAALSDLKAALWLKQLPPAQREDARRLEASILKAAGVAGTAASETDQPAVTAASPAIVRETVKNPPRREGWTTSAPKRSQTETQRLPAPPAGSTGLDDAKPWRDSNATISKRDLPKLAEHTTPPANQSIAPWKIRSVTSPPNAATAVVRRTVETAPIITGSIATEGEGIGPMSMPARAGSVGAEGSGAMGRRETGSLVRLAQAEPDANETHPGGTDGLLGVTVPGLSAVTSLFTDTPSSTQPEIEAARQLEARRLERIRQHNNAMQQSGSAHTVTHE